MAKTLKKSTKKFEKKHLKDVLEHRKSFAKVKQRHQKKEKKRARKAKDDEVVDEEERSTAAHKKQHERDKASEAFKSMTVDDFFAGGFDIPEINTKNRKKVIGKRKREPESGGKDDQSSDDSIDLDRVQSDSEAEDESGEEQQGHKGDLEALAEKDPDFYKYLQENDAELLDFDGNALRALSEDESEGESPKKKLKSKKKATKSESAVTSSMISKWKTSMETNHSTRAMREVVLAFRAAVYSNEETGKTFKYTISSPEVYHQILTTALQQIPIVLQQHLPVKESASGKVRIPTDSKKFQTLATLIMSHASALIHLLDSLSDDGTIKLTVMSLQGLLPYLLSFKKVVKSLVKAMAEIWSDPGSSQAVRLNAFLTIRKLAISGDASIKEILLKTAYQGLIKGSRNTTQHTISGINLMKNSAVDLWGCDAALAYTTGFTYLRQLAIHLRTTLTKPTKDSYKAIYNWQYVHSLDFWSRTLSTHCSPSANHLLKKPSDSPLFPLIYPLVQITLGALRLIPTPTYFPLRFHLVRSLLRISRSTNTYIPLAPALIEVLQSPEIRNPGKLSTIKPLDFSTSLRAPKQYIKTRVYQDGIIDEVSELLAEFFGVWAKSVAFPELIIPPIVLLKRWLKDLAKPPIDNAVTKKKRSKVNRNPKLVSSINLLIQKLNLNAEFIQKHRRKLEFAPKDREQLERFLKDIPLEETPMGGFVAAMRDRKDEQRRILEESRRQEDEVLKRRDKAEDVRMVDVDEDDEEEEEEGEGGGSKSESESDDADHHAGVSLKGHHDSESIENIDNDEESDINGFINDEAVEGDSDAEDDGEDGE